MNVDHVPVRDFSGSADPLRDMHRTFIEARRRMEQPRVKAPPPPVATPAPAPVVAMIPPPDYVMTKEAYSRALRSRRETEKVHRPFLRVISAVTGISITAILSNNQSVAVTKARRIAFYLIRHGTALSYPDIGRRLKNHHSTVLVGCTRVEGVIIDLRITKSSDPVEMCDRLWSARWPSASR